MLQIMSGNWTVLQIMSGNWTVLQIMSYDLG